MSFNHELIERTQKYFHEKHGLDITEETAIEYLDSMADLYVSFGEFVQINNK
jgi:hypothetical protein